MTRLVPAEQIEERVGARRHATAHLGRADSAERMVYILHSQECLDSGEDLRQRVYSRALDHGITDHDWAAAEDRAVVLMVAPGLNLLPDPDEPDDVVLLDDDTGT